MADPIKVYKRRVKNGFKMWTIIKTATGWWTFRYTGGGYRERSHEQAWTWMRVSRGATYGSLLVVQDTDILEQGFTGREVKDKIAKYGWMFVDPLSRQGDHEIVMPNDKGVTK